MSELQYERESKKQIWVSLSVYRALLILAKVLESNADCIGDTFIRDILIDKYPQLFEHQVHVLRLEQELIKSLHKPEGK